MLKSGVFPGFYDKYEPVFLAGKKKYPRFLELKIRLQNMLEKVDKTLVFL